MNNYKQVIKDLEEKYKNINILRKNDSLLEVVLEGTTIKILLKKKTNKYIGYFKEMEFESDG